MIKFFAAMTLALFSLIIYPNYGFAEDVWYYTEEDNNIRWDYYLDTNSIESMDNLWGCSIKLLRNGEGWAVRTYSFSRVERGIRYKIRTAYGWEDCGYVDETAESLRMWNTLKRYITL